MVVSSFRKYHTRIEAIMKEAPIPFPQIGGDAATRYNLKSSDTIRVAFLTDNVELETAMRRSLHSTRFMFTQVCSSDLVLEMIQRRLCDVAITDIEVHGEWPHSLFTKFDQVAAQFPVITLCRNGYDALNCLWQAQYVPDVVPYEMVNDPRFPCLIEAAAFRAVIRSNIFFDDGQKGARLSEV